jgi:hypothetical protein
MWENLDLSAEAKLIVQSATRHGIAPLLYRTLSRIDDGNKVPEDFTKSFVYIR